MKKAAVIVSSIALLFGGTASPILANQHVEVSAEKEETLVLTLEKVLKESLENSGNLKLLNYQYQLLEIQEELTERNLRDIRNAINSSTPMTLETRANELYKQFWSQAGFKKEEDIPDPVKEELKLMAQIQSQINQSLNMILSGQGTNEQLRQQRTQLEDALEQLATELEKSELQLEETKEGIRLMMIGRYIELLSIDETIQFRTQLLEMTKRDYQRAKTLYEVGMISNDEVEAFSQDIKSQELEIESTKKQYELELLKLQMDLNLDSTKEIVLEPIPTTNLRLLTQRRTMPILVRNTYQMQRLREDFNLKADKKMSGKTTLERRQHNLELDMMREQIRQTELDLEKKILQLYFDVEKSYKTMKDKEQHLDKEEKNYNKLRVRHHVGFISDFDLQQASILVTQAEFDVYMAKNSYFMMTKQVEALEKGFIN